MNVLKQINVWVANDLCPEFERCEFIIKNKRIRPNGIIYTIAASDENVAYLKAWERKDQSGIHLINIYGKYQVQVIDSENIEHIIDIDNADTVEQAAQKAKAIFRKSCPLVGVKFAWVHYYNQGAKWMTSTKL